MEISTQVEVSGNKAISSNSWAVQIHESLNSIPLLQQNVQGYESSKDLKQEWKDSIFIFIIVWCLDVRVWSHVCTETMWRSEMNLQE